MHLFTTQANLLSLIWTLYFQWKTLLFCETMVRHCERLSLFYYYYNLFISLFNWQTSPTACVPKSLNDNKMESKSPAMGPLRLCLHPTRPKWFQLTDIAVLRVPLAVVVLKIKNITGVTIILFPHFCFHFAGEGYIVN